jgi:hypothetical protein
MHEKKAEKICIEFFSGIFLLEIPSIYRYGDPIRSSYRFASRVCIEV